MSDFDNMLTPAPDFTKLKIDSIVFVSMIGFKTKPVVLQVASISCRHLWSWGNQITGSADVGERDRRRLRERMVAGHRQEESFVVKRDRRQPFFVHREQRDGRVQLVVDHLLGDVLRGDDLDPDLRKMLVVLHQLRGDQVIELARQRTDGEGAPFALVQLLDLILRAAKRAEDHGRMRFQDEARLGQGDPLADTVEQGVPISSSSDLIWWLSVGCEMPSLSAARVK